MKPDLIIDEIVKDYVTDIVVAAKEYDESADIDVGFDECLNDTKTLSAHSAIITSDIGMIAVFPDFNKNSAKAAVVRIGEIKRLVAEGFDEEFIENKGIIYGDLLDYNKKHVNMFGYYLTHKINP